MTSERLRERLSKIEAILATANTAGERAAAREVLRRVRARFAEDQPNQGGREAREGRDASVRPAKWRRSKRGRDARGRWTKANGNGENHQDLASDDQHDAASICMTFRVKDQYSKYLLLALARQHGVRPQRSRRWPELTIALEGPESVLDDLVLDLAALGKTLAERLTQTTKSLILEKVQNRIDDRTWLRWGRF